MKASKNMRKRSFNVSQYQLNILNDFNQLGERKDAFTGELRELTQSLSVSVHVDGSNALAWCGFLNNFSPEAAHVHSELDSDNLLDFICSLKIPVSVCYYHSWLRPRSQTIVSGLSLSTVKCDALLLIWAKLMSSKHFDAITHVWQSKQSQLLYFYFKVISYFRLILFLF